MTKSRPSPQIPYLKNEAYAKMKVIFWKTQNAHFRYVRDAQSEQKT